MHTTWSWPRRWTSPISRGLMFPQKRGSAPREYGMLGRWHLHGTETNPLRRAATSAALAMLWPLLKEMQVAEIINQHLPADPQAEYDHGRVLSLLIAARLYSPVALVNVGSWAAESGADILWDIPVEKLNDDRFGRSVDTFFSQRHSILASLALHVSRKFDVPLSAVHYDPTHILLHGRYEESQSREKWQADQPMAAATRTCLRPTSRRDVP